MTKREAIDTLRRYLPPDLLRQVLAALETEDAIQESEVLSYDGIYEVEGRRRALEQGIESEE